MSFSFAAGALIGTICLPLTYLAAPYQRKIAVDRYLVGLSLITSTVSALHAQADRMPHEIVAFDAGLLLPAAGFRSFGEGFLMLFAFGSKSSYSFTKGALGWFSDTLCLSIPMMPAIIVGGLVTLANLKRE